MAYDDFARHVAQNYPRWSRTVGRVTKVQPFGVFVEFDDGIRGIIRRRELTWTGEANPPDLVSPGQSIEVVVISADHDSQRLELSRRLVEHDPWQDFVASSKPGQAVRGQVLRLMPYGAFVELLPGVVGLVHVAEIAPWFVEQVEDVLWVGDYVQAEILSIDPLKRHVALSIKKYLYALEREATHTTIAAYLSRQPGLPLSLGDRLGLSARQLERYVHGESAQASAELARFRRGDQGDGKILIVDDEQKLAELMASWLYKLGYKVDTVYTGMAGVERALANDYTLIFMDLNLPDTDGLEATRRILAGQPAHRIVLITGAHLADEHSTAIETINFAEVLLKPFTPQEVADLLERLARGEPVERKYGRLDSQELAEEIGFFQRVSAGAEQRGSLAQVLAQILTELQAETGATSGAVFEIDPTSRGVSLAAGSGQPVAFDQFKHRLGESPVKDVALDRQVIWEKDARGRGIARFRYLLPLLDFNSCLGVPIKAQDKVCHGLFLFHPHKNHFTASHLQRTLATALVIGAVIERRDMEQMIRSFQQLSLVGQLSSGLAHEVNNKLASIEFHTGDLLHGFERLEREHPDLAHTFLYRDLHRAAESIAAMNRSVLEITRLFRTLTVGEEPRLLNINEIIQRTLLVTEPLARKYQVELKHQLAPDLPRTLAVGVRLQQAFHNVILNAIQQIATQKESGRVEVVSTYVPDDPLYPLKVRIVDDGPGIHAQHFETVFSLGFTTRQQEGTGLGLYITRGLLESMDGRITVAESVILVGTTFLIELPLVAEE